MVIEHSYFVGGLTQACLALRMDIAMHAPLSNLCRPVASKRGRASGSLLMAYSATQKRGVHPGLLTAITGQPLFEVMPHARQPYRSPRIALEEEGKEGAPGLKASVMVTAILSPAPMGEAMLVAAAAVGLETEVARILIRTVEDEAQQRRMMNRPTLSALAEWRKDLEPRLMRGLEAIGIRASDLKIEIWSDVKAQKRILAIDVLTRPMDYPITVRLSGSVAADPSEKGQELRALYPFTETDLSRFLAEQVERSLRVNDLKTSNRNIRGDLSEKIRVWLTERGYESVRIELNIKPEDTLPPTDYNQEVIVDVQVVNYDQNLKVTHRIQLELDSLFEALKAGDPIYQIKSECERVTRKVLYNRTYADVVLAFDQFQRKGSSTEIEEIRNAVKAVAAACGYNLVLLVSLPDAPPNKLQRDGVHLRVPTEDKGTEGAPFELRDVGVMGAVKVSVDAKLPELSRLAEWIAPNIDLQIEMERVLRQALSAAIRRMSAHRFHTEFSSPASGSESPSVAEELAETVRSNLTNKFHLLDASVDVRMAETDLVARFKRLRRGSHRHQFEFQMADQSTAGETIAMEVVYTVEGIAEAGWNTFQARDYLLETDERTAICEIIELDLRRMLAEMAPEHLATVRGNKLQHTIATRISEKIARSLGLSVDINTLLPHRADHASMQASIGISTRESAIKQGELAQQAAEDKIVALMNQRRALYERRQLLLSEDADLKDIEAVDRHIENIEKGLLPGNTVLNLVGDIRRLPDPTAKSADEHLRELLGIDDSTQNKPDDEP